MSRHEDEVVFSIGDQCFNVVDEVLREEFDIEYTMVSVGAVQSTLKESRLPYTGKSTDDDRVFIHGESFMSLGLPGI